MSGNQTSGRSRSTPRLEEAAKYCSVCDARADVCVMAFRGEEAEYCDGCGVRLG